MEGNINRSPSAYLNNPADERAQYKYDQDKDMRLIKFMKNDGTAKGFISFYATHGAQLWSTKPKCEPDERPGTSLYGNNTLVSGDNKGMAAYLYESSYRRTSFKWCTHDHVDHVEPNAIPGNTSFVAAFAQCAYTLPVLHPIFTQTSFSCHWRLFSQHVRPFIHESFLFGLTRVQSWRIL